MSAPPADAETRRTAADAGTQVARTPPDAGRPPPVDASTRAMRHAKAKQLYQKAMDALQENDAAAALELADASLVLRRTARTHVARARALQRLDRTDDGLAALASAERIARPYRGDILAYVLEWKARMLRAQRRFDEARAVMREYLTLEDKGAPAEDFRAWLEANP